MITRNSLDALTSIIERLEHTEPLSPEQTWRKLKAYQKEARGRSREEGLGATAAGNLLHLNRPDASEYIKSIKDDLDAQVGIFSSCIDAWLDHAAHPAAGYTWRITVILRKNKLFELERRFLAAYFKHFYTKHGSSKDTDLGTRALKIGINIPSPPDSRPPPWSPYTSEDNMLDLLQSRTPRLKIRLREVVHEGRHINKFRFEFDFHCLDCGGTIISAPDDPDDTGPAICKACSIVFGSMEDVKSLARHIGETSLKKLGLA